MPTPPLEVADLTEAPEEFRADYVEHEGKFVFDLDKHVSGLKNALKGEREQRKSLTERTSEMQAALDAAKAQAEAAAKGGKKDEGAEDRIAKLEKAIADERKLREEAQRSAEEVRTRDTLRRAYLAAGGFEEDADDVLLLVERLVSKDAAGQLVVEADDPMIKTPEEFFAKEFRTKKPKFFKAREKSGGGASAGQAGGAGTITKLADLRTDADKAAYVKAHGFQKYQALIDAANA